MKNLSKFRDIGNLWLLEEFADVVNQLLPEFLAIDSGNNKVKEQINPRLIRHYTSLGLIDEPHKSGKYAQYDYRHLLQILLVRKLLSQGYGTTTIDRLIKAKSSAELESLLAGGVELQVNPANPALAYLEQLRATDRFSGGEAIAQANAPLPPMTAAVPHRHSIANQSQIPDLDATQSSEWVRIEIMSGLEIHLRSDFSYPQSRSEENSLDRLIIDRFKAFITHRN